MITTAKRLGALLSACLLLWSASISALADEAVMSESEAPALKSNPIIEGTLMFHTTFQQYSPYTRYRG